MPTRDQFNSALQRLTGYRLTRETPAEREAILNATRKAAAQRARAKTAEKYRRLAAEREERRKAAEARRQAARAEREAQREAEREARRREQEQRLAAEAREKELAEERRQAEWQARRDSGADLPGPFDDVKRAIIARVRSRTMTGIPKLDSLIEAVRYVAHQQIPGEVVECGVWRGGSMQAVAMTLLSVGDTDRELHLFDTFEGMPPPTEEDTRTWWGKTESAHEMLAVSERDSNLWAVAGLDDVRQAMTESGYPAERIHYHPGLVEETVPGQAPEQISLLRLDTDWYASTRHELETLYDRLSPGGVLVIDDYGDWDGARKAVDEWLATRTEPIFLAPMGWGRIAVKPLS